MNIKPILRCQVKYYLQFLAAVYFALLVLELFIATQKASSFNKGMSVSGLEILTILATFIITLTSWKEPFRFFVSSGVSRRRFFTGTVSSLGLICCFSALLDCMNDVLFSHFESYCSAYALLTGTANISAATKAQYSGQILSVSFTPIYFFKHYLWCILAYFTFAMIGLFIAVLYYRMNRIQKIWVSVIVPSFSFLLLPILDQFAVRGKIGEAFHQLSNWWMSFGAIPLTDLATRIPLIAVIMAITYGIVRRAEVKA